MDTLQTIDHLLNKRFSPRGFSGKEIDKATFEQILLAATVAPSSFNEQPWRFIYAFRHDSENFQRLFSVLNEKNQSWAGDAAVLMLSVAKTAFSINGKQNRFAWYDTGAAVSQMTLKATSLDVYVHQMGGYDPVKARDLLHIPEDYEPAAMMAMGYLNGQQKSEKPRLPLDEISFVGKWA
jgi:nitroreductase